MSRELTICERGVRVPWHGTYGAFYDVQETGVAWRSDGSEVIFNFGPRIYAVTANGDRLLEVASVVPRSSYLHPDQMKTTTAFSVAPDGSTLVYATCEFGFPPRERGDDRFQDYRYGLARVDLSQADEPPGQLTANLALEYFPVWSPVGAHLAFVRERPASASERAAGALYIRRGGAEFYVAPIPAEGRLLGPPRWSPDGRWLAIVADEGEAGFGLYIVGAAGAALRRLSDTMSEPSWSPDSRELAFARGEGKDLVLFAVALGERDRVERRLGPIGESRPGRWTPTLAWSPAGDRMLYTCDQGICVATLDDLQDSDAEPTLLPGVGAAWAPDGSRIAVVDADPPGIRQADGNAVYTVASDGSDLRPLARWSGGGLMAAEAADAGEGSGLTNCSNGQVVRNPHQNPELVRDCETLVDMQQALLGGVVLNWNSRTAIEQWVGLTVSGTPPRVTALRLGGVDIAGTLPPALGELAGLQELDLRSNRLTGSIPPELGQLASLSLLDLSHSQLTGSIPPELGQLARLSLLDLSHNQLTGSIPPELGQLANLSELALHDNQLTGSIPSEIGQLTNLKGLTLAKNRLRGSIPASLGHIESLETLSLDRNALTGCVPAALARLEREQTYIVRLGLRFCEPAA